MDDDDLQYTAVVIVSAISLCGSIFVVLAYWKFESLRIFAFKLVYVLTIFDGIRSFVSMFPSYLDTTEGQISCKIQGFMLEFSSLAGVLWTGVIAFSIYYQVILQKNQIESYYKKSLIVVVVASLLASIIPGITNDYKYVGGWCWITADGLHGTIYRYGLFYGETWAVIIVILYIYVIIIRKVRTEFTINNSFLEDGRVMERRLRWYPIILIICFTPLTIVRIIQSASAYCPLSLIIFATGVSNLLGLFNAIFYGFNESVKNEIQNYLRKGKEDYNGFL